MTFDIREASRCRALGLWTACVMHMMRVLEVALKVLACQHGIDHQGNWNKTLNDLENALRAVRKNEHGADDERWAAEAGTHLRFIKNAHRNHVMHPLEKYDEGRAVEIFDSAVSFLRHLSTRLVENPL